MHAQSLKYNLKEEGLLRRVFLACFATATLYVIFVILNRYGWFFQFSDLYRAGEKGFVELAFLGLVSGTFILSFTRPSLVVLRAVALMITLLVLAATAWVGAISLSFLPILLLLVLLGVPKPYRLQIGALMLLVFGGASFTGGRELEWSLHMRMLAFYATLIWPIVTLMDVGVAESVRRKLALERLLLSAAWMSVAVLVLDPVALHGLVGIVITFGTWWWVRSTAELSRRAKLTLVSLSIIVYFNNLYNAGQLPAQALPIYLALGFILFSPLRAAALGCIYILLVLYGLLHFESELNIPLALRNIAGGVLFLVGLYSFTSSPVFGAQQSDARLDTKDRLINVLISTTVVGLALLVLYLPIKPQLSLILSDSPKLYLSWLLTSLAFAASSCWLLTLYLNAQQLQLRANDKLKELNEDLEAQRELIERQQEQQNHMFSVIGHELRTPIAALQMLFDKVAPYALGRERSAIQGNIRQATHVLDDLKLIAQPETALVEDLEPVRPADLVRISATAMESQLNDRNVDLELSIDREARMVCEMSPKPLRKAVTVLLKNVSMHSRATAVKVSLEAMQSNGKLILDLRVEDNGTGVRGVEVEQLFRAFYRHSPDSEGLGLGLSIARTLIEAQGGRLEYFDSHLGGAGFHVHLEPALGNQLVLEQMDLPTRGIAGLRVLLVEDNYTLRMLTKAVLEKAGAVVSTAGNGREALELVQRGVGVDLVLTDIFMPKMDGYELCRQLRGLEFSRVILGVTAATVGRESQRMIEAGADACLSKPLSVASVELAYQRVIKGISGS